MRVSNSSKDGYIMGLDFGTSNIKGALYDLNGSEVAFKSIEYNLLTPSKRFVENDVNNYWELLKIIFKNLLEKIDNDSERIIAIGTTSQGETIVPIDKNGNPLRNAIVWIDTRSVEEAQEIRQNFNSYEMYKITGQPDADTSWPASRIRWLKKHEPKIFKNTYKFLLLEDFIAFKLTGGFYGEAGLYNSSYYYDVINFNFIDKMLDFLEIDSSKLPEIKKPGAFIGNISKKCSDETGLSTKTKVVLGEIDQICGAIGAGNIESGIATETTGSAFAMVITTEKPIINMDYKIPFQIHAVPGLYSLMPYSVTGGMVLKWFKDTFCQLEEQQAKDKNTSVYRILDDLAMNAPAGCDGLIMLPHICGAFFPEYNSNAKGVYFGISINQTKEYFIRAILESLSFMMKQNLELISKLGVNVKRLISTGGGAKSELWCQIKSDVCNINLEVPEYTETALLGAAVMAAWGSGIFKDIKSASKNLIKIKEIHSPNKNNTDIYERNYKKYKELYESVKKLF